MTCEEALILISGHIDQENTPEEEVQLQTHLASCSSCRELLAAFYEMDADVAELTAEAPAGLQEDVMNAIRAEAPAKKRKRSPWKGIAVAAALILVVGMGVMQMPVFQSREEAAAPMTARAMPGAAADTAVSYSMEMPAETVVQDDVAVADAQAYGAVTIDPQSLAEERQADVAVTDELLPEMEVCPCETLEDGSLLYQLETADGAVNLSRIYGVALYQPANGASAEVSYALLATRAE